MQACLARAVLRGPVVGTRRQLNTGLVGLPNVGKSSLFNAIACDPEAARVGNFPFCTIDANRTKVIVPDAKLERLHQLTNSKRKIPALLEMVDIAGLIEGCSKGEGLGNKFLADVRDTNAIIHVVRCFEDADVLHIDAKLDPVRDIEIINVELAIADLEIVEKRMYRLKKLARSGDTKQEVEALEQIHPLLAEGKPARIAQLPDEHWQAIKHLHLITQKPVIYCANVAEANLKGGCEYSKVVHDYAANEDALAVNVSANIECELVSLDDDERAEYLGSLGVDGGGAEKLIKACYELLGLRTFYTTGEKETRAWTITDGATAPEAAARIHSDFLKTFVRAEVVSYEQFCQVGSMEACRKQGALRSEGASYVVGSADVVHFLLRK